MKIAVVMARAGSRRLPRKALLELAGIPLLAHVIRRGLRIRGVDRVVLATAVGAENDALAAIGRSEGIEVVRGPEENVVQRFLAAVEATGADQVVRLTGDNPLVDHEAAGFLLERHVAAQNDLTCITGLPVGAGVDIYSRRGLEATAAERDGEELGGDIDFHLLEHPGRFCLGLFAVEPSQARFRLTVDDADDFARVGRLFGMIGSGLMTMTSEEIIGEILHRGLEELCCPRSASVSAGNLRTAELLADLPRERITPGELHRRARS